MPQNKHEIQLYETQQRSGQGILEEISRGETKLILLEGLSGVGKDAVLDAHRLDIESNGGVILEPNNLISHHRNYNKRELEDILSKGKRIISTVTPSEMELVIDTLSIDFPNLNKATHVLQGLSLEEISNYIFSNIKYKKDKQLLEHIALYSLGILLLGKRILADRPINEQKTVGMSSHYLSRVIESNRYGRHNIQEAISRYFQFEPPEDVLSEFSRIRQFGWRREHIYDNIDDVLNRIKELEERGFTLKNTFFVSTESIKIYNAMLKAGRDSDAWIDIYVPDISHNNFEIIRGNLGLPENLRTSQIDWFYVPEMSSPLLYAFGATNRKVNFWIKDQNGEEYATGPSPWDGYTEEYAAEFEKRFKSGEFPLKPTTSKSRQMGLFVHSHDHLGLFYNPVAIGYMMESQLQQLGVPYIADNRTFGRMYFFNPEERRIEILKK